MSAVLNFILSFLKSPIVSVLFKYIIDFFAKKQQEKDELLKREEALKEGVEASAVYAGRESEALAVAMEKDERIIEAHREGSEAWLRGLELRPVVKLPSLLHRGVSFQIVTENISEGTLVFADKKWRLGSVGANGILSTKLIILGKRSIDVLLQDHPEDSKKVWVSFDVEIVDDGVEELCIR